MKLRVAKKVFNKAISKIKLTKKERLDIDIILRCPVKYKRSTIEKALDVTWKHKWKYIKEV